MDSLSGLYQLLDSRVGTFSKLCRLQGKLDLMLAQQTAMVNDGTPRDLAAAINTPLMTVTAGGIERLLCIPAADENQNFTFFFAEDSYIGNHIGEEGGTESEVHVTS